MPNQAPNPKNYGRALLSVPPQAIAPNPHTNLLNVYIQLANKMGFQQTNKQTNKNSVGACSKQWVGYLLIKDTS
jgi:hypothetical protein